VPLRRKHHRVMATSGGELSNQAPRGLLHVAEILKANVIFRAMVCPRGRHVVRFTFEPFAGAFNELVCKVTNGH
jgi:hypothetical protein